MSFLYEPSAVRVYYDSKNYVSMHEQACDYATSTSVYVGNLSFFTTEAQIRAAFARCGLIKSIIMGLNRQTKTPCGFCFVVYFDREAALYATRIFNKSKLDDRIIHVAIDYGYIKGREFGRGRSGMQTRDEYRTNFDADRGDRGAPGGDLRKRGRGEALGGGHDKRRRAQSSGPQGRDGDDGQSRRRRRASGGGR